MPRKTPINGNEYCALAEEAAEKGRFAEVLRLADSAIFAFINEGNTERLYETLIMRSIAFSAFAEEKNDSNLKAIAEGLIKVANEIKGRNLSNS